MRLRNKNPNRPKMKRKFLSHAILCLSVSLLIFSCKKSGGDAPPDTTLTISVADDLGNKISGASVTLYSNIDDWALGQNEVAPIKTTDSKGEVIFTGLSPIKYYWGITSGCKSNINGSNTTASPISRNINNTVGAIVKSTGIIKFVNNSSNPYRIYVNGAIQIESMEGKSTKSFYYTEGSYNIRVLQLSGYAISPTDKTYTGNVTCGGTLIASFP